MDLYKDLGQGCYDTISLSKPYYVKKNKPVKSLLAKLNTPSNHFLYHLSIGDPREVGANPGCFEQHYITNLTNKIHFWKLVPQVTIMKSIGNLQALDNTHILSLNYIMSWKNVQVMMVIMFTVIKLSQYTFVRVTLQYFDILYTM